MKKEDAFAEVVTSSLISWQAQSWQWDVFPKFGSLVCIEQKKRMLIGLVHEINTGSIDPSRYPFLYKKTEEELLREQPQIFEFLRTTFTCAVLGYYEHGVIRYQISPEPSKIHAFVKPIDQDLEKQFFSSHQYIHLLFASAHTFFNLDELLLALLTYASHKKLLTEKKLERFIDEFMLLSGNDYRRLKLFLQRVEPIIQRT